ncbi:preprotein translocase subunit TatC [Bosea sp. Root670]|uniref:group III truncated hemoglobin n=1 Tax=unclassified Bosea (in: a-proteobacteria) TaxID=2653178 RepID=UPI000713F0EB|nr:MULTISPECIES: group III truncated hemoglobin [unclassified Bosea (in: a-proteobacteria)]KRE02385.1 preprotein translocase subunit TatC [Bosea sp. Root670]TQI73223.1 hemoglobin [Bosea sp. AK1]
MTDNPLLYPGAAHPDLREPMIAELVRTFYARAREDKLIGPVFEAAVEDWDHHIGKITDFWSGVMLRTGRYDGRPMRPHLILPLEGKHFDRWLDLFEITAHEVCPPDIAQAFIVRARRIADSFEMARASQRGEFAAPRHSLRGT